MGVGGIGIGTATASGGGGGTPVVLSQIAAQGPSQTLNNYPGNFIFDMFDRAPQSMVGSIANTGQAWTVTANTAAAQIVLDSVKNDGTTSLAYIGTSVNVFYVYQSNGGIPITHAECAFSFSSGVANWGASNAGGMSSTLALDSTRGNLQNLIHLNFGPNSWALSVGATPGTFTTPGSGTYNILLDGTVYHIGMDIDYINQTVTVNLPDGTSQIISCPQIGPTGSLGIQPTFAFLEIGYAATYFYPQFKGFVISDGHSLGPNLRAFLQAAPMEEITNLRGMGMSQRSYIGTPWAPVQLTGGIGWYTIAKGEAFQTFNMAGKVRASVWILSVGVAFAEFDVAANNHVAFPAISQKNSFQNASGLQQVRVSTQSGSPYSQLDIYVNTATPVNLFVEFIGQFAPVPAPVVGATALTNSVVQIIGITPVKQAYITNSSTSATTVLTAAGMYVGTIENILNMTGAITAASTLQLPAVAGLLPLLAQGDPNNFLMGTSYFEATTISFKLRIINGGGSGAGVWTVIADGGATWTLNGAMTLDSALGYRDFLATITSSGNVFSGVLQSVSAGVTGAI